MNRKQIAITLGIMCLVLTMAIVVQIRTINNTNQTTTSTFTSNNLKDQVLKWKERYDAAYSSLQVAEKNLEEVRKQASDNTEGATEKEEELKRNNMLLGLTDVTGEGVIVTLKDNDKVTADTTLGDVSEYIVHYSDILGIVNELKNAGAEAISINDQRITSVSAITCEGNIISVNGEKVSSPFVIKAIGRSTMYSALNRPGGTLENLNNYIIATIEQSKNITVEKYAGVISSKYMKNNE